MQPKPCNHVLLTITYLLLFACPVLCLVRFQNMLMKKWTHKEHGSPWYRSLYVKTRVIFLHNCNTDKMITVNIIWDWQNSLQGILKWMKNDWKFTNTNFEQLKENNCFFFERTREHYEDLKQLHNRKCLRTKGHCELYRHTLTKKV